ncbi:hypothetical protein GW17_00051302, partial [Ensete ventricosum]
LFDGVVVVEFEKAVAGSCMKKTTAMSAAQMVLCNALFDGVMGVEVKDAVAGSCIKKTMTRAATVKEREIPSFTGKKRRRHRDGTGSDSDVKQRKGSNRIDMLRKKGWPTTLVSAIEKTDGKGRKQRGLGSSRDLEHSQASHLQERLRGRRPLVPRLSEHWQGQRPGRWLGWEPWWGISLEIYSSEKEKVAALAVRSCPTVVASQKRDR